MLRLEAATRVGDVALDVALEVPAGRCLALAGPSGAGKTTVLRIAAGLLRPARGRITCAGRTWLDTAAGTDLAPAERRCGYVFQQFALFGHLSAWQNVAFPLRGLPRPERRRRAHDLLERFGLAGRVDARPASLSGGEQQRVALARALARRPDLLLLDEPLSALDPRTRGEAARELGGLLAAAEVPALLVTHDFAEAAQLGDRVAVLVDGEIVQEGEAAELAAAPRAAFVADFTGASVLRGTASPAPGGLTRVALDGGGEVVSPDAASGPVAVGVHPWDVALAPPGPPPAGSARNRVTARVTGIALLGPRARVGLALPQPLAAEVTADAVSALGLRAGDEVVATWKATATRLVPR